MGSLKDIRDVLSELKAGTGGKQALGEPYVKAEGGNVSTGGKNRGVQNGI